MSGNNFTFAFTLRMLSNILAVSKEVYDCHDNCTVFRFFYLLISKTSSKLTEKFTERKMYDYLFSEAFV
jgi:hypothetical protein